MENNRQDAFGWFYERAVLFGIEIWGTGAVLNHDTVPQGLNCYDLYTIGDPNDENDIFISKNPVEGEKIGAILSVEPLPFRQNSSLSIKGTVYFEDEPMQTLENIINSTQQLQESQQVSGFQLHGM